MSFYRDGERVEAADVLDPAELRAYQQERRTHHPSPSRPITRRQWDELGYSRETGNWEPGHEGEREERR